MDSISRANAVRTLMSVCQRGKISEAEAAELSAWFDGDPEAPDVAAHLLDPNSFDERARALMNWQ